MDSLIFVHGLESSGKGFKGRLLKSIFPNILTPDFKAFDPNISMYELLDYRMKELNDILSLKKSWIVIGSSFGGLMATLYTLQNPRNVRELILLAPFLKSRRLRPFLKKSVDIPVIVFHGKNDKVVPYLPSQERAKLLFTNLIYNIVDDDHSLHKTVKDINWEELVQNP